MYEHTRRVLQALCHKQHDCSLQRCALLDPELMTLELQASEQVNATLRAELMLLRSAYDSAVRELEKHVAEMSQPVHSLQQALSRVVPPTPEGTHRPESCTAPCLLVILHSL